MVVMAHVIKSGTSSVFITELLRVTNIFGSQLTDKKHFRILIIAWIVIFMIAMSGVILARRSSYKSVILG